MKKVILFLILLALLAPHLHAEGMKLGVGAFGGFNIPVVQDDQKTGSVFGLRARLRVLPILTAEPNVTFGKWGSPDEIEGIKWEIDGSKINSYGIDAIIGNLHGVQGFKPFGFVGAGIYNVKNDDTDYDESKLGFSGGLGFAVGLSPTLDIDVAGRLVVAPQEDGSKKAFFITTGLNFYFNFGQ